MEPGPTAQLPFPLSFGAGGPPPLGADCLIILRDRLVVGIVHRDDSDADVLRALQEIIDGNGWLSPQLVLAFLRVRLPVGPRPGTTQRVLATLTRRESEVALLAAQGHTNGEIAESLNVTVSTVRFHMGNVLHKLGCRDRIHLGLLLRTSPPSPIRRNTQ